MSWVALGSATISAGGAIGGGLLAKKQKSPQIPRVSLPGPGDYEDYPFIEKEIRRLEGQPGFGDDFVDKASSPIASNMRRNFRNVTSPFISNQYSARGLGRSNLAADAQGKAEGDVESGIGAMFADLYRLNEVQKSNQATAGLAARERKFGRAVDRTNAQAGIDMGFPGQQFGLDQLARGETNTNEAAGREQGLALSRLFTGQGGQDNQISQILSSLNQPQGAKTKLLGDLDSAGLSELMANIQSGR